MSSLGARERILETAADLFYEHGFHAVGVDLIIERAGVAKTTLYRHFPSKDDLIVACPLVRSQLWAPKRAGAARNGARTFARCVAASVGRRTDARGADRRGRRPRHGP
jgi:hypothetical protein